MAASALAVLQLLVPILLILLGISALTYYFVRRHKRAKRAASVLPVHNNGKLSAGVPGHRRRSSIYISADSTARQSDQFSGLISDPEKRQLSKYAHAPAPATLANLPEIRVTLPQEVDSEGKTISERVVIVHLNDKGVETGMESVPDEPLPPYERFESLDLERLGGLKEKETAR